MKRAVSLNVPESMTAFSRLKGRGETARNSIETYRPNIQVAHDHVVRTVEGTGISDGVVRGSAVFFGDRSFMSGIVNHSEQDPETGTRRFQEALGQTRNQLEQLQREVDDDLSDIAGLIFQSHLAMLEDTEFTGQMLRSVREGVTPETAVISTVNSYLEVFSQSQNGRVTEKCQDVKDIGHRLLSNLAGYVDEGADYSGNIVVANELYPSELIKIHAQVVGRVIRERNRKTGGRRKTRRNHDENRGSPCAGGALAAHSSTQTSKRTDQGCYGNDWGVRRTHGCHGARPREQSVKAIGIESRWGPPDLDQMSEDTLQFVGILDDGDHLHVRTALWADHRIDLIDLRE